MVVGSLVFRCRRCSAVLSEPCDSPAVEIRRRIETGQTFTLHECDPALGHGGGATGVCELLGEGERPRPEARA
jgi:hypothetical protein